MHSAIHFLLADLRWAMAILGLAAYAAVRWWLRRRRRPARGSVEEAPTSFQASIAGMLAVVVAALFSFDTPVESTFGLPTSESDVTKPQRLLHLMQLYNHELVSASETVRALALLGLVVLATAGSLSTRVADSLARFSAVPTERGSDPRGHHDGA